MINDNDDDTWYMWIIVCGSNGSQDSSLVITRSTEPNRALSSPIPHDRSDNDGGDYVFGWCGAFIG